MFEIILLKNCSNVWKSGKSLSNIIILNLSEINQNHMTEFNILNELCKFDVRGWFDRISVEINHSIKISQCLKPKAFTCILLQFVIFLKAIDFQSCQPNSKWNFWSLFKHVAGEKFPVWNIIGLISIRKITLIGGELWLQQKSYYSKNVFKRRHSNIFSSLITLRLFNWNYGDFISQNSLLRVFHPILKNRRYSGLRFPTSFGFSFQIWDLNPMYQPVTQAESKWAAFFFNPYTSRIL